MKMRSFFLFLCGFLLTLPLSGAELGVRIADCIGDDAVRAIAIQQALSGGKTGFSQIRALPETALAGLAKGEYDVVLIRASELPEKLAVRRQDYAVEAAMAAVAAANPRSSYTSRELAEIWSGWRKSWKTLNGGEYQIHLLRQPENRFAVRLFRKKIMGKESYAPAFEREGAAELLRILRLNEHAMVLCERPDVDFSTEIKPVSVNGIYPSLDNIRSGRYPLCDRRVILYREPQTAGVRAFLQIMCSAENGKLLAEHGLIQP